MKICYMCPTWGCRSADTKTAKRACSACPARKYRTDTSHRATVCTDQPACGKGTKYVGSATAQRTCAARETFHQYVLKFLPFVARELCQIAPLTFV